MSKILRVPVHFLPAKRRADGSVTLSQATVEEISTELFSEIDEMRQTTGFLLYSRDEIQEADIPTENAILEEDELSPSQRLRRTLFKLYMTQGGHKEDFPQFYRQTMQQFQNTVVSKIQKITGE